MPDHLDISSGAPAVLTGSLAALGHPDPPKKGATMANWTELKQFLYNSYKIEDDSGDSLRMLFDVGGGRSQFISVHNFDPLVTFSAPFGKVGQIKPETVLQSAIPFGVAQAGDIYFLIHTSWIATLDDLEVHGPITVLVNTADELEKKLTGKDVF